MKQFFPAVEDGGPAPASGCDHGRNVVLPGPGYWREQIRCQSACPVHTDARGYVRAIAEGDYLRDAATVASHEPAERHSGKGFRDRGRGCAPSTGCSTRAR